MRQYKKVRITGNKEEIMRHHQVYSVTIMTHVKALQAGHSSQGTSEPITPVIRKKLCES